MRDDCYMGCTHCLLQDNLESTVRSMFTVPNVFGVWHHTGTTWLVLNFHFVGHALANPLRYFQHGYAAPLPTLCRPSTEGHPVSMSLVSCSLHTRHSVSHESFFLSLSLPSCAATWQCQCIMILNCLNLSQPWGWDGTSPVLEGHGTRRNLGP